MRKDIDQPVYQALKERRSTSKGFFQCGSVDRIQTLLECLNKHFRWNIWQRVQQDGRKGRKRDSNRKETASNITK